MNRNCFLQTLQKVNIFALVLKLHYYITNENFKMIRTIIQISNGAFSNKYCEHCENKYTRIKEEGNTMLRERKKIRTSVN